MERLADFSNEGANTELQDCQENSKVEADGDDIEKEGFVRS